MWGLASWGGRRAHDERAPRPPRLSSLNLTLSHLNLRAAASLRNPTPTTNPHPPHPTWPAPPPCPCSNLASDDGMQQMQYLLSGMFGRACKSLGSPSGHGSLADEVGDLRRALTDKLAGVRAVLPRCMRH